MDTDNRSELSGMVCDQCSCEMKPGKATLSYLGSTFPVELLKCPKCGLVFIPEELATGKMDQVENTLEDK